MTTPAITNNDTCYMNSALAKKLEAYFEPLGIAAMKALDDGIENIKQKEAHLGDETIENHYLKVIEMLPLTVQMNSKKAKAPLR